MAEHIFSGADKVSAALEEIAKKMNAGTLSVGFMAGATYPDGTPVAAVAFWNEFGRPDVGQPPRPFFRQMIASEAPGWAGKMAKLAKATDYDGEKVLALMGEDVGGALVQSIRDFTTPGLAESTIKAKGFSQPLADTNHMKRSVCYQVDAGAIVPIKEA